MDSTTRAASLCCILAWLLVGPIPHGVALECDLTQYQPRPGLVASAEPENLVIECDGESGHKLRARFAIDKGMPTLRELAIQPPKRRMARVGEESDSRISCNDWHSPHQSRPAHLQ